MEIVLLRHGVPAIDTSQRISASEFGRWLRLYDEASIDAGHPPPPEAIAAAVGSFVVCSNLRRSFQSAEMLGARPDLCSPDFREIDMPFADWRFPRLSPKAWCVTFRLSWLAGFAPDTETLAQARARARVCADRLSRLADEHKRVMFVGHGSLLWQVARDLARIGWRGPARAPRRHWEFATYRRADHTAISAAATSRPSVSRTL